MAKDIRVRYAPSPTGSSLYIGKCCTALFNYCMCAKCGPLSSVIEDTESQTLPEDGELQLETSLVGADRDESPETVHRQSERLPLYQKIHRPTLAEGKAYKFTSLKKS